MPRSNTSGPTINNSTASNTPASACSNTSKPSTIPSASTKPSTTSHPTNSKPFTPRHKRRKPSPAGVHQSWAFAMCGTRPCLPTATPRGKVGSHSTPPRYHTPEDVLGRALTAFLQHAGAHRAGRGWRQGAPGRQIASCEVGLGTVVAEYGTEPNDSALPTPPRPCPSNPPKPSGKQCAAAWRECRRCYAIAD